MGGLDISWQKKTDNDGKVLPDNGRSTIIAIIELFEEYENDPTTSSSADTGGDKWCPKLVQLFKDGVPGKTVEYPKDDSLAARRVYQAGKHHIENNKFAHTSIHVLIEVARYAMQLTQNDPGRAEEYLMAQHGRASRRSAHKWILAARQIYQSVLDALEDMDYLKPSYILENEYFVSASGRAKEQLLAETYQLRALKLLKDEDALKKITTSAAQFSSVLCRSLKAVHHLESTALRKFGAKLLEGKPKDNLVAVLCTQQGLKRVHGCLQAGIPLQGKSEQEVGILEVRQFFAELEKCKAGGDKPAPTNRDGLAVPGDSSSSATRTNYADIKDAVAFASLCGADDDDGSRVKLSDADREHVAATQSYIESVTFHNNANGVRLMAVARKDSRTLVCIEAATSGKVGYATLVDLAFDVIKVNSHPNECIVITSLRARYDLMSDVMAKLEEKFLEGALVRRTSSPKLCLHYWCFRLPLI